MVRNPSAYEGDIRDEGLILFKGLGCDLANIKTDYTASMSKSAWNGYTDGRIEQWTGLPR